MKVRRRRSRSNSNNNSSNSSNRSSRSRISVKSQLWAADRAVHLMALAWINTRRRPATHALLPDGSYRLKIHLVG